MAILKPPIDWGFISRLSKDYDFYEEFGRVVVRLYPRHIRQPATERQQYTWWHFGSAQGWWDLLPKYDKDAWKRLCAGSTWRNRDYYMHLALKVLGNPGFTWIQMADYGVYYFPTFVRIVIRCYPWRTPKIRFRWDTFPGEPSPVHWSPIGHKIRNKKVLRTWQLSDGLPSEQRWPTPGGPLEWWFDMYYPPKWARFWYRTEWDYRIGPAIYGGWTGLYYIDNPAP